MSPVNFITGLDFKLTTLRYSLTIVKVKIYCQTHAVTFIKVQFDKKEVIHVDDLVIIQSEDTA